MEPWRARLAEGEIEAAWNLFIDQYRRLIIATIRRTVNDEDSVLDVFAHVCQALSSNDLARLRKYSGDSPRTARFSTWLVTVVHHLVVDWLRQRNGRRRLAMPEALSALQQQIFICVFVEQRSHAETFERVRTQIASELSFTGFLKDLAETYRAVERTRPMGVMHYLAAPPLMEPVELDSQNRLANAEFRAQLDHVLGSLSAEERLALQLFIVEGMQAQDVARTLGWPNAKAVYNRVYRTLTALRAALERRGFGAGDL